MNHGPLDHGIADTISHLKLLLPRQKENRSEFMLAPEL